MANRKLYELALQIGGKVNASLGGAFGKANKNLTNLQNRANNTHRSFSGMGKALGFAAGALGAYMSVTAIKQFETASVEAAKKQIEAETKLEAVLKNVRSVQKQGPEAYKQAKNELVGLAGNLQRVGVIGDEVTIAGMQQLATFQLSQKEISVLSGGMADLLSQQKGLNATQEDAVTIANMVGKVMDGQTAGLRRVGISLTKNQEKMLKVGNSTQRAAILAQVLQQNVGGVNKALAQTDQGKIKQMQNNFGDMQEQIGMRLLPKLAEMAAWFNANIPTIQQGIFKIMDSIDGIISSATKVYNFFSANWGLIAPIISGVGGAFIAFNTVMGIASIVTWATTAGATALAGVLTFIASPIGIAVIVIGALIAAGVALYQNWDLVKAKAAELGSFLVNVFKGAWEGIKAYINYMLGGLNKLIIGANAIGGKVGINIPTIPAFARGTNSAPGGLSLVGEKGAELANIPRGSSITPVNRTEQLLKGLSGGGGQNITISAPITIKGNADAGTIQQAVNDSFSEFERKFNSLMDRRKRLGYA